MSLGSDDHRDREEKIQQACSGQYWAGLWGFDFELQLLWYTTAHWKAEQWIEGRRPRHYVAPSWSWASVIGLTELPGGLYSSIVCLPAKIISIHTEPIDDPMGGVRGGHLRIQGCLFPFAILLPGEIDDVNTFSDKDCYGVAISVGDNLSIHDANFTGDVSRESRSTCKLHCLVVAELTTTYSGIVLIPTNEKRGQFRRIGIIDFPKHFRAAEEDADEEQYPFDHWEIENLGHSSKAIFNQGPNDTILETTMDASSSERWAEYESYDGVNEQGFHCYTVEII